MATSSIQKCITGVDNIFKEKFFQSRLITGIHV